MNTTIGILIGISISSFYWWTKFKNQEKTIENMYIEYAERCEKWKKLQEQINNIKPKKKSTKGVISCK